MATLKEIAASLNLSVMAVSKALRDAPDISVSTKAKVQAEARRLNYIPNRAAQNLRLRKSGLIGVVVPQAWVGLTADVFIQLMNGAGDAGRQKVANLAGTVSPGGAVGVTEQVAPDRSGTRKFIWTYIYQANLNGKLLTSPLTICSADIKVTGQ